MKRNEFEQRRKHLLELLEDESVVLISAAKEAVRNHDCHFPFRQDSDFHYLSNFNEPDALLVLTKSQKSSSFVLFNRPNNEKEEMWEGKRAGQSGARTNYGADEAYDIAEIDQELPNILANKKHVYYRVANDPFICGALPKWLGCLHKKVRAGVQAPEHFVDISDMLAEMRLIKSDFEIDLMRRVCQISADAHCRAMKAARHADYEYQLQAELQYGFLKQGCQAVAYNSIVAAGANACILHYTENNQPIKKDDLILIDAGGELDNYAADITRTFPKSGSFNDQQRAIYQIVLEAQKAGVELIKPGVIWTEIQEVMVKVISEGLIALDILKGSLDEVIESKAYRQFYMHSSGHWLGLDVHDKGQYKEEGEWRSLKEGMTLTVEPGIYIAEHHKEVDSCWHNIGVRIEDDILVTQDGYENLTRSVPKEVDEIEALMSNEI